MRFFTFFGLTCLFLAGLLIWQRTNPNRLKFNLRQPPQETTASASHLPISLVIKDLNLKLPIIPATLTGDRWPTTNQGVSYLTSSPVPGDTGNSVLYGHNWPNLLGPITKLKPGQQLEVTFSDQSSQSFTIAYTAVVTPDQTHILDQSSDSRLTLYTCIGFLDRKRFVITAIPQS